MADPVVDNSMLDIDTAAGICKQEVCDADKLIPRKSFFSETDVFGGPPELQTARTSAPHWATSKWSSFTTESSSVLVGSKTLQMPGLRTSDEVDIDYLQSRIFNDGYVNLQLLGKGTFGSVCLCRERKTQRIVAVKAVKLVDARNTNSFLKELAVARRLKHENIVRLYAAFRDQNVFYFVMENLSGGSLHLLLKRNPLGVKSQLVCEWSFSLLNAVAYLHHHRLCHRDIKAENVLLESKGEDHPIKLIDFGLAVRFKRGETFKEAVGTTYSMAPEVLKRIPYTETVDVWSAGCVVFELCTGHAPYFAKDRHNLILKIRTRDVEYDQDDWRRHPKKLKSVVNAMLNRNHEERKHADEILQSFPFLGPSSGTLKSTAELRKGDKSHNQPC